MMGATDPLCRSFRPSGVVRPPGRLGSSLVPTLCVGMPPRPLRGLREGRRGDAERRRRHSHAERGNELDAGARGGGPRVLPTDGSGPVSPAAGWPSLQQLTPWISTLTLHSFVLI